MKITLLAIFLSFAGTFMAQNIKIPDYLNFNETLNDQITRLVEKYNIGGDYDVGEDGIEQISFAVIDMTNGKNDFAGYSYDNFIYPASVYKMYAGAALLKKCYEGEYDLYRNYVASGHNIVDRTREIKSDPRSLIEDGDELTIHYLLDLMITRSDNTAANCVIDLANREYINKMMADNGWEGSEVTRKFLSRKYEDPGFEKIRGTETCALHAADFMYKIANDKLENPWVSNRMEIFLGAQIDKSKLASGLPKDAVMYHKTGWWSYWTNDVGFVKAGNLTYVIALFTPIPEKDALKIFKDISGEVYNIIKERNK
ncbi:MAG: serine hydrolase [Melioribacteraceae bacterium]|nr:MAG: serine hydrolase [Melioribacteraceae bacterium]